jgi:hypothetical protein
VQVRWATHRATHFPGTAWNAVNPSEPTFSGPIWLTKRDLLPPTLVPRARWLECCYLPWAQVVAGSNPAAPTTLTRPQADGHEALIPTTRFWEESETIFRRVDGRLDRARLDRTDADAERPELLAQGLGEPPSANSLASQEPRNRSATRPATRARAQVRASGASGRAVGSALRRLAQTRSHSAYVESRDRS